MVRGGTQPLCILFKMCIIRLPTAMLDPGILAIAITI
jgi:hypothetical protein